MESSPIIQSLIQDRVKSGTLKPQPDKPKHPQNTIFKDTESPNIVQEVINDPSKVTTIGKRFLIKHPETIESELQRIPPESVLAGVLTVISTIPLDDRKKIREKRTARSQDDIFHSKEKQYAKKHAGIDIFYDDLGLPVPYSKTTITDKEKDAIAQSFWDRLKATGLARAEYKKYTEGQENNFSLVGHPQIREICGECVINAELPLIALKKTNEESIAWPDKRIGITQSKSNKDQRTLFGLQETTPGGEIQKVIELKLPPDINPQEITDFSERMQNGKVQELLQYLGLNPDIRHKVLGDNDITKAIGKKIGLEYGADLPVILDRALKHEGGIIPIMNALIDILEARQKINNETSPHKPGNRAIEAIQHTPTTTESQTIYKVPLKVVAKALNRLGLDIHTLNGGNFLDEIKYRESLGQTEPGSEGYMIWSGDTIPILLEEQFEKGVGGELYPASTHNQKVTFSSDSAFAGARGRWFNIKPHF